MAEKPLSNFIGLLLSVIVFNFGIQANICYYYLDKCHEFSYAMGAEMMTRIHMLDEGNLKKIAIVGTTYPQTKLQDEPGAKDLYNFIPSLEKISCLIRNMQCCFWNMYLNVN